MPSPPLQIHYLLGDNGRSLVSRHTPPNPPTQIPPSMKHTPSSNDHTLQIRLLLGDNGRSLVVGLGPRPPCYAAVQSASCELAPAVCNAAVSEFSADPNPQVARGSLIFGNYLLQDAIEDSRVDTSNMAAVGSSAPRQCRNKPMDSSGELRGTWTQALTS